MLKPTRSHQDFQNFIIEQLGIHYFQTNLHGTVLLFHHELAKVWITDLSQVYKILAPQYSGKKGAPPRDPVDMFRSLLLMELTHAKSVDDWVKALLVDRFLKHPPAFKQRPHDLLQQIFKQCFVLPSAEQGLLGDLKNLSAAGDGSSVRTGARRYGKLNCDCRKQRIFNCRCARRYSDPDASWGWDSYREEYYFGRGLYAFTAADSPYDLPIYLNLFKAQRHDSVAFVSSFFDQLNSYPEFNFGECLLDCQVGHLMTYHGYCKNRQRHKWRCPKTRKKWNVACDSPCSTSKYGRVFYTREQDNLRYFTRIPRKTPQWKNRYKRRTTVERYFKRLKEDYSLQKRGKIRSSRAWYVRTFLASMCLHTDAWVKHQQIDRRPLICLWFDNSMAQAA